MSRRIQRQKSQKSSPLFNPLRKHRQRFATQETTAISKAEASLFRETPTKSDERQILFEQYKLYVEMADRISERRQQGNAFFLTINTVIIAALSGALIGFDSAINFLGLPSQEVLMVGCALGAFFCFTWWRLIASFDNLNTGKFYIIHQLETRLPAQPYHAEWIRIGEGRNRLFYLPFSRIERWIPVVFYFIYILGALLTATQGFIAFLHFVF